MIQKITSYLIVLSLVTGILFYPISTLSQTNEKTQSEDSPLSTKTTQTPDIRRDVKTPPLNLPNATFEAIAISLLAVPFTGCIARARGLNKLPYVAFTAGTGIYFFKEITSNHNYNKSSKKIATELDNVEESNKQVASIRLAAKQKFASEELAQKKSNNANLLKNTLIISSTVFGVNLFKNCVSRCSATGLGAFLCVPKCLLTYNSCSFKKQDLDANPSKPNTSPSTTPNNNPMQNYHQQHSPLPPWLSFLLPKSSHASTKQKSSANRILSGLGSAKGVVTMIAAGFINKLKNVPDIAKIVILTKVLRPKLEKASKQWEDAATQYNQQGKVYEEQADQLEKTIKSKNPVSCQEGDPNCTTNNNCQEGDPNCTTNNNCKEGDPNCTTNNNCQEGDPNCTTNNNCQEGDPNCTTNNCQEGDPNCTTNNCQEGDPTCSPESPTENPETAVSNLGSGKNNAKYFQHSTDDEQGNYCATGSPGNFVVSNCSCLKNYSCTRIKGPRGNFSSLGNGIPSFVGNSYDALTRGGNELYRGDPSRAQRSFDTMNKNAAKMSKYNNQLLNRFKQKASQAGQPWDQLERSYGGQFSNAVSKFRKSLTPSQMQSFAAATGAGISGPWAQEGTEDMGGYQSGSAPTTVKSYSGSSNSNLGMQDNLLSYSDGQDTMSTDEPNTDNDYLEEYEYNQGEDIVENSDITLWNILSKRYLLSAYPKFFQKK